MSKVTALALTGAFLLSTAPARAAEADRALLSTFCDAANIKGSTCKRAKGYPNADKRACDVTLTADRYGGKIHRFRQSAAGGQLRRRLRGAHDR